MSNPSPLASRCDLDFDIALIGGGFALRHITREGFDYLRQADSIFFSTQHRNVVAALKPVLEDATLIDLDYDRFHIGAYRPELYSRMATEVVDAAKSKRVAVLEPGSVMITDAVTQGILQQAESSRLKLRIIPGVSCIELVLGALKIDPAQGIQVIQALALVLNQSELNPQFHTIVVQAAYYDTNYWVGNPVSLPSRSTALGMSLRTAFPPSHPFASICFFPSLGEPTVQWYDLGSFEEAFSRLSALDTLYIPPASSCKQDAAFFKRVNSWAAVTSHVSSDFDGHIEQRSPPMPVDSMVRTKDKEESIVAHDQYMFEISVPEVVHYLKINGEFLEAVQEIAERRLALEAARKESISPTDQQVQDAFEDFRVIHNLRTKRDFEVWLDATRLTVDDVETYVRDSVTIKLFKESLATTCDRDKYPAIKERTAVLLEEAAYSDWLDQQKQASGATSSPHNGG